MLQQTQVARVIPKYQAFIKKFPNLAALARAPFPDVLRVWQGLGYNRRARHLWEGARYLSEQNILRDGVTIPALSQVPGIGTNTAGAIIAYAFDRPVVFIETNIRTVFIHHFFKQNQNISDQEILKLVAATLPKKNIREWYSALMDYGTSLKKRREDPARRAQAYQKQSPFQGSVRQLRGAIIRALAQTSKTRDELAALLPDERLPAVLMALVNEQLIRRNGSRYRL